MVSTKERDKVAGLLDQGGAEGGDVRAASTAPDSGAFLAPHVVRGVEHGSSLTRYEIFGPVAPVVSFETTDEAVRDGERQRVRPDLLRVRTRHAAKALAVARRMESGMVAVNRGVASDPAAPFGGMKESGLGREGGFAGIHEFLETQYLAVDL